MINSNKTVKLVNEKINKIFPVISKPKVNGEINLPEDPSTMTGVEVSQKMTQATSWFVYCDYLLGLLKSELLLVEAEYKIKLNAKSVPVRTELGRQNADVIEAVVLEKNPAILPLFERLTELKALKAQMVTRLEIYKMFHSTLSREQSRREAEMRMV